MDGDSDRLRSREPDFNPYAPPEPVEEPPEAMPAGPLPGSPPGLSVTYRNDAADIAAYAEYYATKFTRQRRNLRLMMGLILAVLVGQAVLFRASHRERFRAPIMIVGVVGLWLWMEFASRRRKTTLPVEMPLLTLILTPSGVVTRNEQGGGAQRAWAAIPRIDQSGDHIYLFEIADKARVTTAHVVPRRAFSTPEAADEFLATARRWHAEALARPAVATDEDAARFEPENEDEDEDEPTESLAVTFTLTEEDRRRGSAFFRSQRRELRTLGLGLALGVIGSTVLVLYLSRRDHSPFWLTAIPIGVVYVVVGLLWWRTRSAQHPSVKEGDGTPTTFRITPTGFAVRRGGVEESSQSWNARLGIGSTDEFIIFPLVVSADLTQVFEAHLIPRRAFETPEAADAYLRAARRWHAEATGPAMPS